MDGSISLGKNLGENKSEQKKESLERQALLYMDVQEKSEWGPGASRVKITEKNIPGRSNGRCKGLNERTDLEFSRDKVKEVVFYSEFGGNHREVLAEE